MGNSTGASIFPSLLDKAVFWFTGLHSAGVSGDVDEFPIIPSGVTVTNNGTFYKSDLGNNKSVLIFDGSTNYISLTDNDAWNFGSGDFSICGWINLISLATGVIYAQENSSAMSPVWIDVESPGKFWIGTSSNGTTWINSGDKSSSTTMSLNTWYHFAVVRTSTSLKLYLNGVQDFIDTSTLASVLYNATTPVSIGACATYGPGSYKLNGKLKDYLIIKGKALSAAEIALLMNRTHPITGKGMMVAPYSYWRLS